MSLGRAVSVRSDSRDSRRPSRTPSTTQPAYASASCRSKSKIYSLELPSSFLRNSITKQVRGGCTTARNRGMTASLLQRNFRSLQQLSKDLAQLRRYDPTITLASSQRRLLFLKLSPR